MAEIIAPGIPLPTFDTAVPIKRTFLNLCKFRVKALLAGQSSDPAVRGYIDEILGGKTFDEAGSKKMACDQVRTLFYAVAARKRSANTQDFRPAPAAIAGTRTNEPNQVHSIADLNKRNSEFYAAAK